MINIPTTALIRTTLAALAMTLTATAALAGPHGMHRGDGGVLVADARGQWWDGAHGHRHSYPVPGWRVHDLPPRHRVVFYGGVRYSYFDGVWYSPGPSGYLVVRPPFGVVVSDLPAFATVLTIGAASYWYVNGTYYRPLRDGAGYEVVQAPVGVPSTSGTADNAAPAGDKLFVYPRQNQSAEKQASDEYECHRWAVTQSGFDPTATATATAADGGAPGRRSDYSRAQAACLDGRGYTVK
ncbi:MAG: hypothetical protein RLZZ584_3603 [Pseudomonadota bacterium]|jgi:hypothetical protein